MRSRVVELGDGRLLLDLDFRETEGLIAAYLLPEPDGWALVETGPSSCRDALLRAIDAAGVARDDVRDVLLTHIHLDHAGGAGVLAEQLPRATFHAHELGVRHLADPSRLVESSRRAWGAAADSLWGAVLPVPAERLRPLRGGEALPLKRGELQVIATPGHARHHLAYLDTGTRAVMAGDAAGVLLEGSERMRPAVPAPDLDLAQLYESLERLRRAGPRRVLLTHFGPTPRGPDDLLAYRAVVERWRAVALSAALERPEVAWVADRLRQADLAAHPGEPEDRASLVSGYDLAAQGFLRYFQTHGELPGTPS